MNLNVLHVRIVECGQEVSSGYFFLYRSIVGISYLQEYLFPVTDLFCMTLSANLSSIITGVSRWSSRVTVTGEL
jgi:hypothetical protein